jgi:hypothetical protein
MAQFSIDEDEVNERFGFHPATEDTRPLHENCRAAFILLGEYLVDILPEGREKSLAFTALQEASMWSNAAIAMEAPLVGPPADLSLPH